MNERMNEQNESNEIVFHQIITRNRIMESIKSYYVQK